MNMSFWSQCQGLVRRLERRPVARRRERPSPMTETLEPRTLLSSTPVLIADISPGSAAGNPGNFLTIGSTTYFTASDGAHGAELWRSDGTAAGTTMVKDVNPGSGSSNISNLTDVNGTLFFRANDATSFGLWKSDGTAAGTVLVFGPGSGFLDLQSFTNVNGTLFFSAYDSAHGYELWKSDGTAGGTTIVKDIFPGGFTGYYGGYYLNSSSPGNLTNVSGTLFFTANDGVHGYTLWKSDGTEAGTTWVGSGVSGLSRLTNVNGTLFFAAYGADGNELWKSDGTSAGTTLVKDIFPGVTIYSGYYGYSITPNSSNPDALTVVNGTLFFTAADTHRRQVWKSDGTEAGTVMVTDIPIGGLSYSTGITEMNGTLYFSASDGQQGIELWKSDGTAAGTRIVKDVRTGSSGSYPDNFASANGTLYFRAIDSTHGYELWKSDGTAAGTVIVRDIFQNGYPGSGYTFNSSFPGNLTAVNGILLFTANDGIHGNELWALNTAPAPSLDITGFQATTTAGVFGNFTVTARNADGSTNTGYRGKVHFTSSDPRAELPADYTFTAADKGAHTFTLRLKTAGFQSIDTIDTQSSTLAGSLWDILVKPAAASTMSVGGFPSSTFAGVAQSITVTLKDQFGNIASGYRGTVRVSSSDRGAVLPSNYTFTAADAGVHTFSVILKKTGKQSISARDIALPLLTATQGGITVLRKPPRRF